jgi:hypothetical protein
MIKDEELLSALNKSKTTYNAPFFNDALIGWSVMAGLYGFLLWKLVQSMYSHINDYLGVTSTRSRGSRNRRTRIRGKRA